MVLYTVFEIIVVRYMNKKKLIIYNIYLSIYTSITQSTALGLQLIKHSYCIFHSTEKLVFDIRPACRVGMFFLICSLGFVLTINL